MGVTTSIMAGLAVLSAVQQSSAMGAQSDYNSRMSEINIRRSKIQEEDAIRRGGVAANKHRQGVAGLIGSQKVNLAAQGIDVASGSAADLIEETGALGEADAKIIENNAFREALGFSQQQADYRTNDIMQRGAASTNRAGTLLRGGIQAASYMYDSSGSGKTKDGSGAISGYNPRNGRTA